MDICALPKDMGPCPGAILRWHFDAPTKTCRQFMYGGCRGNGNRFKTEEECENRCFMSSAKRGTHLQLAATKGTALCWVFGLSVYHAYVNTLERNGFSTLTVICLHNIFICWSLSSCTKSDISLVYSLHNLAS